MLIRLLCHAVLNSDVSHERRLHQINNGVLFLFDRVRFLDTVLLNPFDARQCLLACQDLLLNVCQHFLLLRNDWCALLGDFIRWQRLVSLGVE